MKLIHLTSLITLAAMLTPRASRSDANYNTGLLVKPGNVSGACSATRAQTAPGTTLGQVTANSATASRAITNVAGNLLVAFVYGGQAPGGLGLTAPNMKFTMSDTKGNTYYAAPYYNNNTTNFSAVQIFFAPNVLAGSNTVTVTASSPQIASGNYWTGMLLVEYSGMAKSYVVDAASGQTAPSSTTAVTPGSILTTTACDLTVAGFADGFVSGQTVSAGGGWVMHSSDQWNPANSVDNVAALSPSGTVVNASMTESIASSSWVATQVAFRTLNTRPPNQPGQLAFTTGAQTLKNSVCSSAVTVQSQFGSGVAAPTAKGINLTLGGTNVTYFIDSACQYPITTALIGAGTNSTTFYFAFGDTSSNTISVSAPGYTTISQTETLTLNPFSWVGGASCNGVWTTLACWGGGALPSTTDIASFDTTCSTNCSPTLAGAVDIGGLWIHPGYTGTVGLSSFTMTLENFFQQDAGTFNGNTGSVILKSNFNMLGGTFTHGSGTITLSGNWNHIAGTYTANTGTVTLTSANHTFLGNSTFYKLNIAAATAAYQLTFQGATRQTVTNTLSLAGASGKILKLRSSTIATEANWYLTPPASTTLGGFLDVEDGSSSVTIHSGASSVNTANNINWSFP